MNVALWLLAALGIFGALDTVYYHEWRARLPARGKLVAPELYLHAARDCFYAMLFGTLPWLGWHGLWTGVLVLIVVVEIVITLWDFVVEITVRKPFGDVYGGERVMHALMGIVYGAMVAYLIPVMWDWKSLPTGLVAERPDVPGWLIFTLLLMALGVFASGIRDLYAARGLQYGNWPWPKTATAD
jgi:hypothetical protein